ncbi:unnamed protein product [Adineta ricciae]|uniref:Uncharacterized protein n=1 Tax=Adineta ricciae TaxID=249248 RepID=A0A813YN25_ADIRI|nr:unnamed protein product [Adineta ricciae]CAF1685535.1 unnamed protein product [Adineta ricciae]
MSKPLTRTYSLRKHVRPMVDIDEEDDEQRRDSFGRKRVAVVDCLLDSSSDETEEINRNSERLSNVLWLTLTEICHIRRVIVQTTLSLDKQCSQLRNGTLCFQCRKKINSFFFIPLFFQANNRETCYVCQQTMCKKCSYYNFTLPSLKILIPVQIQTLLKPSAVHIEQEKEPSQKTTSNQGKIICYDCLRALSEHRERSQSRPTPPISPFRRTFSLPPVSEKNSSEHRYTRHRYRPLQVTTSINEKSAHNSTSSITKF